MGHWDWTPTGWFESDIQNFIGVIWKKGPSDLYKTEIVNTFLKELEGQFVNYKCCLLGV